MSSGIVEQHPGQTDVLVLRNLTKKFAGTIALDGVDLRIKAGEIHSLLGHNGSGKSTLIKTLAGYHTPEPESSMEFDQRPVSLPLAPGEFRELGIAFVFQDLALVPSLTVLENLRVLDWSGRGGVIRWRSERKRASADLRALGVDVPLDATVASLSQGERALVAVARAASDLGVARRGKGDDRAGLLVLDEPTVFLSEAGRQRLFALIHRVAELGAGVLFVSHDLDEVLQNTDTVTVLRDGKVVGNMATSATSRDELIRLIVGKTELPSVMRTTRLASGRVAAHIEDVAGGTTPLAAVSFDIYEGEILGATGLLGSGFDELPYLLFGALPTAATGRVVLDDGTLELSGVEPSNAIARGLALIPSNRPRDGGIFTLPAGDNMMLLSLETCRIAGRLSNRRLAEAAGKLMDEHDVRPRNTNAQYGRLSGGNQQKALVAKWLVRSPRLLLLDEPTQGVDVGARQQIVEQLRDLCETGGAVLYCSADHAELAEVCDRVLIFRRGRLVRTLMGDDVNKDRITNECIGVTERGRRDD